MVAPGDHRAIVPGRVDAGDTTFTSSIELAAVLRREMGERGCRNVAASLNSTVTRS
jgi:hypothetical protein